MYQHGVDLAAEPPHVDDSGRERSGVDFGPVDQRSMVGRERPWLRGERHDRVERPAGSAACSLHSDNPRSPSRGITGSDSTYPNGRPATTRPRDASGEDIALPDRGLIHGVQIVGYETPAGALFVSDGAPDPDAPPGTATGEVDRVPLDPGTELSWRLGDRRCAGTVHDGGHVACGNEAAPYCADHRSTWVCARCTGTCLKDEMDCFDDHAIYVAAFAPDTFKVGVTRDWRLDTRLREQGADRAVHLRTVENGRIAREIEAGIAAHGLERVDGDRVDDGAAGTRDGSPDTDGLPDRVRVPTKVDGLGAAVDEDAWSALLAGVDYEASFAFDYGLDLVGRPVAETLASGTVVGTKGRVLVLENGGTTYAVDVRDLVGYEVVEGDSEPARQSSLGSFG